MLCPVCNLELVMSERQGVEIDYCPQCRGVWLDRGELDKIIERSNKRYSDFDKSRKDYREDYREDERYEKRKRDHRYKKRKSVIGELFDMFD